MTSLTIYKRELTSYFAQPTPYAIMVIFLALSMGLTFSFGNFMRVGDASLEWSFFFWHPWIYMLLAPAVGMKLWADEQRTGTIELLGTFPLSTWSAIIGKFLAAAQGNTNAANNRDFVLTKMTPEQVKDAQKRAADFLFSSRAVRNRPCEFAESSSDVGIGP